MVICDEKSIEIDGEEYWTVQQFSKLTRRKEGSIRVLISKGNRLRALKWIRIGGKPFIRASELFEFPFVINGRPTLLGVTTIEKYRLQNGRLVSGEEKVGK